MILQEQKRTVESNLTGESRQFTIAATGKAFSILVSGIYSDAIGSIVREITSNAYDAHIRNGNPDVPFETRLPNSLNPTFSVRDYGCSMTHEFMMDSYSTLFESSKSGSNNEVGAFGLGAKSVYSYTDAFSITCWLDGEVRSYAVGLNTDGIPAITLVHRAPSTERQGVEVNFAVAAADFQAFNRAFVTTALGYDTPPAVVGGTVVIPHPSFSGTGWRLYSEPSGYGNQKSDMVRQGCAVYPAPGNHYKVFQGYYMVVDVAIGDANVTASREALALTGNQARHIETLFEAAKKAVNAQVKQKYDALPDQYSKAMFAWENEKMLGHSYPMHVDFPSDTTLMPQTTPNGTVVPPPSGILQQNNLVHVTKTHVKNLSRAIVVYDDGSKIIRRARRLKALTQGHEVFITENQSHALAVCKAAHLKPGTQLMKIDMIPDVYMAPKGTGTPRVKKVITSTRPWAISKGSSASAGSFNWQRGRGHDAGPILNIRDQKFIQKCLPKEGLLYMTELEHARAVKKGTIVGDGFRIDNVVKAALLVHRAEALNQYAINAFSQVHVQSVRKAMIEKCKLDTVKVPDASTFATFDHVLKAEAMSMKAVADQHRVKMAAKYPLLFGYDEAAVKSYMDTVDAAKGI